MMSCWALGNDVDERVRVRHAVTNSIAATARYFGLEPDTVVSVVAAGLRRRRTAA